MEKNSRKRNQQTMEDKRREKRENGDFWMHFKECRKDIKYGLNAFQIRNGRQATEKEKEKIIQRSIRNFRRRMALRTGSLALAGFTLFSTAKMLGEGSGKIEGVTQENPKSVTVDANNFRDSIKVVGLGDEGVLLVQNEDGQEVQITNQNVNDIKEQNDLIAQREAQIQQIRDDIKNIDSKEDVLKYIKKFYKEQYKEINGHEIAGDIVVNFYGKNSMSNRVIEVAKVSGEIIEKWIDDGKNENGVVLDEIGGNLWQMEDIREYYRNGTKDEYLSREGGEKDKLTETLINNFEKRENQKSEGIEPGE